MGTLLGNVDRPGQYHDGENRAPGQTCWPGLHLGPPTAASRYPQMLTPVATGEPASLAEVERRRWQGPNCYVLVGPPYLAELRMTALEYSALPPLKMAFPPTVV